MERRQMTRYDFGAIAEVVDLNSREDVVVVTRDLSFAGCFVKTRYPFPAGTEVRVRITYAGCDFAALGNVTGNVTPEGMGIEFLAIEPKDQAIIEEWLSGAMFANARGHQGAPRDNVVQMKNRLRRSEPVHRSPSTVSPAVSVKPKQDKPKAFASSLLDSARNLLHIRDEARH
jgi:PilZ domain-containing protein